MVRRLGATLAFATITFARAAHADDVPVPEPPVEPVAPGPPAIAPPQTIAAVPPASSPDPYRFHAGLEIPLVALGAATLMTALVPRTPPPCLPNCEVPSSMNALDRQALGARSQVAGTFADIGLFTLLLAPHIANVIGTRAKGCVWLEDLVVSAEATLLAVGVSQDGDRSLLAPRLR